jgi:hypothetical protein
VIVPQAAAAGPTRPGNLRITATTSASVSLAWNASTSSAGIAYYTVLEKSTWTSFNVTAPQTTFTRTRLWPNINHGWIVYAVDKRGRVSADSNMVTYRTPPDTTAPSTPALSDTYVGPTLVELDWTDSVDDVGGVTYTINVSGRSGQFASQSRAVVPALAPTTSYTISVTARDQFGNTTTSNAITVTTPPRDNTTPPTAPPNFRGSEQGGCEARLRWDPSTDDVDPASVIRYDAYVNGQFDGSVIGVTKHVAYAVQNGTNTFTLVAVDSSGNESPASTFVINNMWLC